MMDIYEDASIDYQHRRPIRHADLLPPRENTVMTYPEARPREFELSFAQTKRVSPISPFSLVALEEVDHQVPEDVVLGA